jgi:small subunit ribosomal protein S21
MIIIKVDNKRGIERALKEYKSKVIRTRQSREIVNRKEFKKTSQKRREEINRAIYRQKLDNENRI